MSTGKNLNGQRKVQDTKPFAGFSATVFNPRNQLGRTERVRQSTQLHVGANDDSI
jgi:hypothetical protein